MVKWSRNEQTMYRGKRECNQKMRRKERNDPVGSWKDDGWILKVSKRTAKKTRVSLPHTIFLSFVFVLLCTLLLKKRTHAQTIHGSCVHTFSLSRIDVQMRIVVIIIDNSHLRSVACDHAPAHAREKHCKSKWCLKNDRTHQNICFLLFITYFIGRYLVFCTIYIGTHEAIKYWEFIEISWQEM